MSNNRLVWILGFTGFISAADNWIVSPILPEIAATMGISIPQAGIILTAYMIPYGLMQPVYGFLGDRLGKKGVLQWIVSGLAIGTLGCAMAGSLWLLCLWRTITGLFAAGLIAVSLALIGDTVPVTERQKYVGKFMGIVFMGQGISVGLGGLFANLLSWRLAFGMFAFLALAANLLLRSVKEHEPPSPTEGNFLQELARVVRTPKGIVIFPTAFAAGFLLLSLYGFLGSFLHEVTGLNDIQIGLVVMGFGFACLAGGTQVGTLSRNFGRKNTVLAGCTLSLLSTILLAFAPHWASALLATLLLGLGYIFIQSTLATIAFDVASSSKGLPSALVGLGLFGGGGLGSAAGSAILSTWSYHTLWLLLAVGIVALMLVITRLRWD